jgi:hypothetical protein
MIKAAWYTFILLLSIFRISGQAGTTMISMLAGENLVARTTHYREPKESEIFWPLLLLAIGTVYIRAYSRIPELEEKLRKLPETISGAVAQQTCPTTTVPRGLVYGLNLVSIFSLTLQTFYGSVKLVSLPSFYKKYESFIMPFGVMSALINVLFSLTFALPKSMKILDDYKEHRSNVTWKHWAQAWHAILGTLSLGFSSFFIMNAFLENDYLKFLPESTKVRTGIAGSAAVISITNTALSRVLQVVLNNSGVSHSTGGPDLFSKKVWAERKLWPHGILSSLDGLAYFISLFGSGLKTAEHLFRLDPETIKTAYAVLIASTSGVCAVGALQMHTNFTTRGISSSLIKNGYLSALFKPIKKSDAEKPLLEENSGKNSPHPQTP